MLTFKVLWSYKFMGLYAGKHCHPLELIYATSRPLSLQSFLSGDQRYIHHYSHQSQGCPLSCPRLEGPHTGYKRLLACCSCYLWEQLLFICWCLPLSQYLICNLTNMNSCTWRWSSPYSKSHIMLVMISLSNKLANKMMSYLFRRIYQYKCWYFVRHSNNMQFSLSIPS